jgi:DNA-binding transcriptional regulator GbsR (MarR family)
MAADEGIDDLTLRLADRVGALMEVWGFKRTLGRMWAVLYFSPQPMTAAELGERLAISAGAVSMTLGELSKWGVIKKSWRPGERRDYYEPETAIWKMVSRVLRERELVQIQSAIEIFEAALATLKTGRGKADALRQHIAERVASLLNLARVGETLLSALLDGKKIDPTPIRTFLFAEG